MPTTDTAVRLLVVDDDPDIRQLVRLQVAQTPQLRIVAEASDGAEALGVVAAEEVDAVLLDLHMPTPGLAVLPALRALAPRACIIAWSGDPAALAIAQADGATAACDKTLPWREVARIIVDSVTAAGECDPPEVPEPTEGLVDLRDLVVLAVATFDAPVPDNARWPCPVCRDRRPLQGAKQVTVERIHTGAAVSQLLVCAICADDLASHRDPAARGFADA